MSSSSCLKYTRHPIYALVFFDLAIAIAAVLMGFLLFDGLEKAMLLGTSMGLMLSSLVIALRTTIYETDHRDNCVFFALAALFALFLFAIGIIITAVANDRYRTIGLGFGTGQYFNYTAALFISYYLYDRTKERLLADY